MAMNGQGIREHDTDLFDVDRPHHQHGRRHNTARFLLAIVALFAVLVAVLVRPEHHGHSTATPATQARTPTPSTDAAQPHPTSVAGVPVGYPDTREGAQAAAANYAIAYGSDAMFNTNQRHSILDAIADPEVKPALQAQLDQSFAAVMTRFGLDSAGNPPQGQTLVDRTVPVGVHVLSYSDEQAQVGVWSVGIVGLVGAGSTTPVAEAWSTATITLRWTGGDWKWVVFTQTDGPTPVSGMQPPSNAADISKAVKEFGGLDYAR